MTKRILGKTIADQYPNQFLKILELDEKNTKSRTTFRLSKAAKQKMTVKIAEQGYGMRGKSKWVTETFLEFIDPATWKLNVSTVEPINSWKRVVIDTELLKEKLVIDAVNIEESTRIILWKSAIDVALYGSGMDEPEYLDISSASVLRAAIMWKLSQ